MSHEITVRQDGFAEAVFAQTPAWHGLGQVIKDPEGITASEAITAGGLDWEVHSKPIAVGLDKPAGLDDDGEMTTKVEWSELSSHQAIVRADTGTILSVMTNQYKIVQNSEAFACLDALTGDGEIRIEAAFSLRGGRSVCVLARTPGEIIIDEKDRLLPYVLISTAHDGTGALLYGPTGVRVVCANTKRLAVERGTMLSIKHTGDMSAKLEHARRMLVECGTAFFSKHAKEIEAMVNCTLRTAKARDEYWNQVLGGVLPEDATDRQRQVREEALVAIRTNFDKEVGERGGSPTLWNAYNAFSEVVDHAERRGKDDAARAETRFKVTQFEAGRQAKDRAWQTAQGIVGTRRSRRKA